MKWLPGRRGRIDLVNRRSFWGDRNVLYLILDGGYTGVYKCQNSLGWHFKVQAYMWIIFIFFKALGRWPQFLMSHVCATDIECVRNPGSRVHPKVVPLGRGLGQPAQRVRPSLNTKRQQEQTSTEIIPKGPLSTHSQWPQVLAGEALAFTKFLKTHLGFQYASQQSHQYFLCKTEGKS